jgi:hypothetical protein
VQTDKTGTEEPVATLGSMTINVDAAPDSTEINPTTPIITTTTPATTDVATLADWVKSAQFNDPEFQKIVRRLEAIAETGPQAPGDAAFAQHYAIRDGHLWRGTKTPLLWVPLAAQTLVIHQFHDAPDVGHLSQEETARAIRTQYTWPALSADVRQHVRACPVCVTKRGPIKARVPLQDGPPKKSSRRGRKQNRTNPRPQQHRERATIPAGCSGASQPMQNTWPVHLSSARRTAQADLIHAAVQKAPRIKGSNPRVGTGGDAGEDPEKLEGNPKIARTEDDAPDRGHYLTHLQITDTTNDK